MMRILFFLFVEIMHVFIEISISIINDTSINVLFIAEANTILPSFFHLQSSLREKRIFETPVECNNKFYAFYTVF